MRFRTIESIKHLHILISALRNGVWIVILTSFCVYGIFITNSFFNRHSPLNLAFNAQSPYALVSNGGNKHYRGAKCVIIHRHFETGSLWLIFHFYLSTSNLNWILLFMIAGVNPSRMFWRVEAQVWNLFQV